MLTDLAYQGSNCSAFAHNMNVGAKGYGQNIAMNGSSNANAWTAETAVAAALASWYSESIPFGTNSYYGLANPPLEADGEELGHFTAMIWAATTKIGCAVLLCGPETELGGYDASTGTAGTMYSWYSKLSIKLSTLNLANRTATCNYVDEGNVSGEYATNVLAPVS